MLEHPQTTFSKPFWLKILPSFQSQQYMGNGDRTELQSTRNFETHGTSKRTELQSIRNFENVFEALMYLIIPEPIFLPYSLG